MTNGDTTTVRSGAGPSPTDGNRASSSIELTDEQLEAVSGGNCFVPSCYTEKECPICHGHNNQKISSSDGKLVYYYCNDCEKHFY